MFGQQSSVFGQQPSQPSLFGQQQPSVFGQPSQPLFGQPQQQQQTSLFGQPTQQQTSAFAPTAPPASLVFGQPQQQQTSVFGQQPAQTSIFGQTQQQPQQQTSIFGQQQPAQQTTSIFGQPQGQQPTTSLFGQTQPAQQTTSLFGQPQTTGTTSLFGQQPAGQTPSIFGQPAGGTTSIFGQQPQQGTASIFGQQPAGQTTSLFGQPAGQTSSIFGQPAGQTTSIFGQPQGTTSLFGQTQQQPFMLQQQQQQQQQQPQIDEVQAFQQSIFQCHKYGDERDSTLASLNYLQACWGAGKGYYSQTFLPANYNQQNPFYRFKAVGYAFMYTDSNEDGQVVVNFRKAQTKLQAEETTIVACLQTMLARANILIRFTGTKAISEEATMAIIFAEDRNTLRRIPATDMATALLQPHLKTQLENLGVTSVSAKVKPSPEQLKRYLETPPDGIDPRVWLQAQEDNPDPSSMIPTSLIGVDALKSRIEWQEKETQQHHARLKLISEDVTGLLNRHSNMTAELQQMRRKHIALTHRLISIICRQELMRKQGSSLQPEEDLLRRKIEEMDGELNSPTQYKGRLNELLSQIRLHKSSSDSRPGGKYSVDPSTLAPVKDFLALQQESVKHLVATTKSDFEVLQEMMDGLNKIASKTTN